MRLFVYLMGLCLLCISPARADYDDEVEREVPGLNPECPGPSEASPNGRCPRILQPKGGRLVPVPSMNEDSEFECLYSGPFEVYIGGTSRGRCDRGKPNGMWTWTHTEHSYDPNDPNSAMPQACITCEMAGYDCCKPRKYTGSGRYRRGAARGAHIVKKDGDTVTVSCHKLSRTKDETGRVEYSSEMLWEYSIDGQEPEPVYKPTLKGFLPYKPEKEPFEARKPIRSDFDTGADYRDAMTDYRDEVRAAKTAHRDAMKAYRAEYREQLPKARVELREALKEYQSERRAFAKAKKIFKQKVRTLDKMARTCPKMPGRKALCLIADECE
ncbi:MAG: hypothetical protein VYA30_02230 [Myxococcota bacterium]|nr:hypothetical protein [Myxococcota bacterium]